MGEGHPQLCYQPLAAGPPKAPLAKNPPLPHPKGAHLSPLLKTPSPPQHQHTRIWVSLYLPVKLHSLEESALTLVRHENHNHISYPTPRHCGSGREHGKECDSNHWGWSVIYDQIITCFLRAGITHLSLYHKESLPYAFPRAHYLFFPSSLTMGLVQALDTSLLWHMCVYLCKCVKQRARKKAAGLVNTALLVPRRRKDRSPSGF